MTQINGPEQLRVVRGGVSAEELAAVVVVVNAAAAQAEHSAHDAASAAEWNAPHRAIRQPLPHGVNAWRRSALPR